MIIQLPIQELRLFHFSLHSVLPDLRQFMEVSIEELIHGRVFGKSSVTLYVTIVVSETQQFL